MYRLSVGAIIKNESTYILEWIAYHLIIGVEHFYIADNCSDDGQYQMLEALQKLGLVTLIHQENLISKSAQTTAYAKIIKLSSDSSALVAFIDGDEFIAMNDQKQFHANLDSFIADENAGAIALNWKTFGSSGHVEAGEGLVIERFVRCADNDFNGNKTIKTISKPSFVKRQHIHHAILKKGKYKTISLENAIFQNEAVEGPKLMEFSYDIAQVNHYVIKSKDEFISKKMNRGCANRGETKVKLLQYFDVHDLNDDACYIASGLSDKVKSKISELEVLLRKNGYFEEFQYKFDRIEGTLFVGWVKFKNKEQSAKIRVLVDNRDEFYFDADFNRPHFAANSINSFGRYGFNFKLPRKPTTSISITVSGNHSPPIYSANVI